MLSSMLSTSNADMDNATGFGQPLLQSGPRRLTLRMNFLWTLTGNVVYAACQWGILVVLAKLGTPQMIGEFALALAITAPIVIGAGLSLRSLQATDAELEYEFRDYLSLRVLAMGVAMLVIFWIPWFCGYGRHTTAVIFVVGLAKGFESISDIFYGWLQQHERMDRIALSGMIKGALSLIAMTILVYFSGDLLPGVCSLAAVWALILTVYDSRSAIRGSRTAPNLWHTVFGSPPGLGSFLRLHWNPSAFSKLILLALPLSVAAALISFSANIPRYFIEHRLGTWELGIFAAMAYPMVGGVVVSNALGQSTLPRLARYYANGDCRAFLFLLLKVVCLGLVLGVAGVLLIWLAGRPILLLLYRPEYGIYTMVFFWLGVGTGVCVVASLLNYGITAVRYFRAQMLVILIVTLVTIGACATLIPTYRLLGAAIAMLMASACQAVASGIVIVCALRNRKRK
jgi:O-antigen/teichoic acid export membrane protein